MNVSMTLSAPWEKCALYKLVWKMDRKKSNYPKVLFDELCSFRHSLSGCAGCDEKGNTAECDESIDAVYTCYLASD